MFSSVRIGYGTGKANLWAPTSSWKLSVKAKENWVRDYVEKREDYQAAGIAEYWIVDPQEKRVTVLTLERNTYREHGVLVGGDSACSVLLDGFCCNVSEVFAQCGDDQTSDTRPCE